MGKIAVMRNSMDTRHGVMNDESKDLNFMESPTEKDASHIGVKYRSGRYPYGSGEDPYQHGTDFLGRVEKLRSDGWEENAENVRKEFNMSTDEFRKQLHISTNERKLNDINTAKRLAEKEGLGATAIARKMSERYGREFKESTIRGWLKEDSTKQVGLTRSTADMLKEQVDKKGMVDVGKGVEKEIGVTQTRLNNSLKLLEEEGYVVYSGRIPQVNSPNQTTQKVLCVPGTEHKEIFDYSKVKSLDDYYTRDGGETFDKYVFPKSMDSSRLKIRSGNEKGPDGFTGSDKDGLIEIRRGVDDLSLGNSRYAQVRILVDDKKYIKGMAVYSDDLPKGVDVLFNSNKSADLPKLDHLKDVKEGDNPFGSLIKAKGQYYYEDKDGKKQLGLINKTREEGDWSEWKDALPSQFLAKQSKQMAEKQLNLSKANKQQEFDELCKLTNPTIKKHLLDKFADECDSSAVHLQAASLPGQKHNVIIPINTLKDTEVYAPRYKDGTKLALIRYPHGGIFEIPICTVNNKNLLAKKVMGSDEDDAIGVNKRVADRLSGADFDGDSVMCIPTHDRQGKVKVLSTDPAKSKAYSKLINFDPKEAYPETEGMTYMKHEVVDKKTGKIKTVDNTHRQMGEISNLIMDMHLSGASPDEITRAVKHSMVVIDAGKHKLNYKQSEIDNNIQGLKETYQRKIDPKTGEIKVGGASTLITRAKGDHPVIKRQGNPKVNVKGTEWYDPTKPEGSLIYKTSNKAEYTYTKVDKRTGEERKVTKYRRQISSNMMETDDARSLMSLRPHPMEILYADYANDMKSLANKARLESYNTGKIAKNSAASKAYANEVKSLNRKLDRALANAPREREAQRRANVYIDQQVEALGGDVSKKDVRKIGQQAINNARVNVGSVARKNRNIDITDKEWEAIQKGAVANTTLVKILNNTNIDDLRQRATPKQTKNKLSDAQKNVIKSMSGSYTIAQIAEKMGVSTSTVSKILKGGY